MESKSEKGKVKKCGTFHPVPVGSCVPHDRAASTKAEGRKSPNAALFHFSLLLLPSSLLADAGTASANTLQMSGGMSLIDGTFITACLMGIAAIISACGGVIWANRRNARKRPLDSQDVYVTRCECEQHRLAIAKRIDELGPALERIFLKLAENDKKSEERANQMHRRIDPLIEKVAAHGEAIEMIKRKN